MKTYTCSEWEEDSDGTKIATIRYSLLDDILMPDTGFVISINGMAWTVVKWSRISHPSTCHGVLWIWVKPYDLVPKAQDKPAEAPPEQDLLKYRVSRLEEEIVRLKRNIGELESRTSTLRRKLENL